MGTAHTTNTRGKLLDAFKLKQGDALDLEQKTWLISTNYYSARVKFESYEVAGAADAIESELFEKQI